MKQILISCFTGLDINILAVQLHRLLELSGYQVQAFKETDSTVGYEQDYWVICFNHLLTLYNNQEFDLILALDEEAIDLHHKKLKDVTGYILCDSSFHKDNPQILKFSMFYIAKHLGDLLYVSSIALGAILKIFHLSLDHVEEVLSNNYSHQLLEAHLFAVKLGFCSVDELF